MRPLAALLRLPPSLLLCNLLLRSAYASPVVNVDLQASFPTPPLLVELLETAAIENATSYLPLLDAAAVGAFSYASTDEQRYERFLSWLQKNGHIKDAPTLASLKLALSVHEAAPRIEAHYQFWRSAVQSGDSAQPFSAWKPDGQLCLDPGCTSAMQVGNGGPNDHTNRQLHFDRILGRPTASPLWTLYLDPTDPASMTMYRKWRSVYSGEAFRVRYRPSESVDGNRLPVSGYGVELALKKTDYIVIDDRNAEEKVRKDSEKPTEVNLHALDVNEVKPLSSSELLDLGMKTGSFIMQTEDPFDTMVKLAQDFPKHAASLAIHNVSADFLKEHEGNREQFLPAGLNVVFLNGRQVPPREVDAFSLLDHLRRERKLIGDMQKLGMDASEAVALLAHSELSESQASGESQRYDFRDNNEGGNVIMWLNDIEKDKRYASWPSDLNGLLQRVFPGQLPSVRKDIHNIVFLADLTEPKDVEIAVELLQSLVKRMVPARFGIVPTLLTPAARDQAKVMYYLNEAYGLAAVMTYLESSFSRELLSSPSKSAFEVATEERKPRRGQFALSLSEVLSSETVHTRLDNVKAYLKRLGADEKNPPIFVNGVPMANDEGSLQAISQRLTLDLRTVQEQVFEKKISEDTWVPEIFLKSASMTRNPLIIPEDDAELKLFDVQELFDSHPAEMAKLWPAESESEDTFERATLVAVMDVNSEAGIRLLLNAIDFGLSHDEVEVGLKHQCSYKTTTGLTAIAYAEAMRIWKEEKGHTPSSWLELVEAILETLMSKDSTDDPSKGKTSSALVHALGLKPGEQGILINGRLIGPLPSNHVFSVADFETLAHYERKKRIGPTIDAVRDLKLDHHLRTPQDLAKLSSLVALSAVSGVPEGIFDNQPGPRINIFNNWTASHTCIDIGSKKNAPLEVVVSLDPVSETAQRWLPVLRILSRLDGVFMRIFLNPRESLDELPIKRFFRQVLSASPEFSSTGAMKSAKAEFTGIPEDVLLTLALDTPPSWLVAPKESIHDLDNIMLSSLKGESTLDATYELEHILIEGHSRDVDQGQPPRGAQLVLGTETDPDYAGTIVMANLGYFQFKANPGVYNLTLQSGRSQQIFNIDSAGTIGYSEQPGDETTEIVLSSFQGATLFPRLSRKPGHEMDDVLIEGPESSAKDVLKSATRKAESLMNEGADMVDSLLEKAGMSHIKGGEYIRKALSFGQSLLSTAGKEKSSAGSMTGALIPKGKAQADINIFSVASGHLYERMLNIMILSVMKHTNHTVKFWFIEQFLSPSFKTFLPTLAQEYKFDYEMVTYKWPHWLRAQKEKQRVIWGYKILFLDVLFPLDLDKVIFVDADQIVRTDMYDLVTHDLEGAPYGFTPMCDSRTEMEGFRFWKQGYWANYLRGLPYHISALYVVDLNQFRAMAAGDRLRQQYQSLSADPNSLANLDQDLPNHMQMAMPIHSLPQEWLWCETWCDDESLKTARTIDLCNNPQTKEPKLDRARRQVPEWTTYDEEIAALAKRKKEQGSPRGSAGDRVGSAAETPTRRPGRAQDKDEL